MKCPHCGDDLGNQSTITAILGNVMCNKCAPKQYSEQEVTDYAESINPNDIGIEPNVCLWCEDEDEDTLYKTDMGWLCGNCILAIRSRGEQVIEEGLTWYKR